MAAHQHRALANRQPVDNIEHIVVFAVRWLRRHSILHRDSQRSSTIAFATAMPVAAQVEDRNRQVADGIRHLIETVAHPEERLLRQVLARISDCQALGLGREARQRWRVVTSLATAGRERVIVPNQVNSRAVDEFVGKARRAAVAGARPRGVPHVRCRRDAGEHEESRVSRRLTGTMVLLASVGLLGCGSDNGGAGASTPPVATADAEAESTTSEVSSTAAMTTTAATETTAAPLSVSETTPGQAIAATALLTTDDLPGWTVVPPEGDDTGGVVFDQPECADLQALETDPGLQDDASGKLVSPDGATLLQQGVTVGDPAAVQRAFDTFAAPTVATCLQAAFTAALQAPGQLPAGASLDSVELTQQAITAGDQAIGYAGTVTLSGAGTATVGLRVDAVRHAGAITLLITIAGPLAQPTDPAAIATAAAARLTTAIG